MIHVVILQAIRVVHKGSARYSVLLTTHLESMAKYPESSSALVFPGKKLIGSRSPETVMHRTLALKAYFDAVAHHEQLAEYWFRQP